MRTAIGAMTTALLLGACGSTAPTASDELGYSYGPGTTDLRLQARVYHAAHDRSLIYFKLRTRDLLYKGSGGGTPYRAAVRITYEAFDDWGARELIDSASTLVRDQTDDPSEAKDLYGSMDMRRSDRNSFVLRITAHDLNRETDASVAIKIDRGEPGHRQNFLPLSPATGLPLFDDHLAGPATVIVQCEQYTGDTLFGGWHHHRSNLPAPVFSVKDAPSVDTIPDSTFLVMVDDQGRFTVNLPARGFLHLRVDSTSRTGYTIFSLNDAYPEVRTSSDMLPPMRYITSMQEFDGITTSPDKRGAIERFWLDAAGERDRARDAIRTYFTRVENANRHFTSHTEGWKTDRGLVHIIFGTPGMVHKSERSETWVYGEETNLMSLSFTFVKRDDPFTDNDLVLERDPVYKGAWYRNVESWRNGRVYQN